jgi:hypothetical protein
MATAKERIKDTVDDVAHKAKKGIDKAGQKTGEAAQRAGKNLKKVGNKLK